MWLLLPSTCIRTIRLPLSMLFHSQCSECCQCASQAFWWYMQKRWQAAFTSHGVFFQASFTPFQWHICSKQPLRPDGTTKHGAVTSQISHDFQHISSWFLCVSWRGIFPVQSLNTVDLGTRALAVPICLSLRSFTLTLHLGCKPVELGF